MSRRIIGFHLDAEGEWVAELSCLHSQHVRHRPPLQDHPWVLDDALRGARVGTSLLCPLCGRAELPDGLRRIRTAGPFDAQNAPRALFAGHEIAEGRWGVLRVLVGKIELVLADGRRFVVEAGGAQPIPPTVVHRLEITEDANFAIDFLVRGTRAIADPAGSA